MNYSIRHTTKYSYASAVPVSQNLIRLEPRQLPNQDCEEFRLLVYPNPSRILRQQDYFGNYQSYFSIDQTHQGLTITSTSRIQVRKRNPLDPAQTTPWEKVAQEIATDLSSDSIQAFCFVPASRSIELFPELEEYARISFQPDRPILEAAQELTGRIHSDFAYDPEVTHVQTPVREIFEKRHGVCQDFAHLQIACLRSIGLAAKYVSGYLRTLPPPGMPRLVGADASHAWISVYCGSGKWVDLDPTNNLITSTDHVTIAEGRDYSDVCPVQGVIVGSGEHKVHVSVDVAPIE